ncbi:hypothetical protein BCR34DRAFT_205159 [Clohesyomyces aquaticus]|uniref:Uncharacterized protein n=1 Tax=Clohesyomyces aquaticus TaxID=1231657 RepID=A0A1Y1YAH6_9PLEO|nr:hypothetical protein BCR34DRAFT_205159 [Clohesyomyces aquaticus]
MFTGIAIYILIHFVVAIDNATCTGCEIGGDGMGLASKWSPIFNYLNETVYVLVDLTDNSTITTSSQLNTNAAASLLSICSSVYYSLGNAYQNPDRCVTVTEYTQVQRIETAMVGFTNTRGTNVWSMSITYPTSYLDFQNLVLSTRYPTVISGTTECGTFRSFIQLDTVYPLGVNDQSWYYTFYNDGRTVTYLDKLPTGAYENLESGRFRTCTPGSIGGVPTTKIPIIGTRSTVFQYKSAVQSTSVPQPGSSIPGNKPPGAGAPVTMPPPTSAAQIRPSSPKNEAPGTQAPQVTQAPAVTQPSSTIRVLPSSAGVLLPNGETLAPGSATTISGTPFSLRTSSGATALIVGGVQLPIYPPVPTLPPGYSLLPSGAGLVMPNGQILPAGSATTLGGTTISLASLGSSIVIGSSTIELPSASGLPPNYFVLPSGGVLLPNGGTLTPGEGTVVSGDFVSFATSNSALIFGGTTVAVASPTSDGAARVPNMPATILAIIIIIVALYLL